MTLPKINGLLIAFLVSTNLRLFAGAGDLKVEVGRVSGSITGNGKGVMIEVVGVGKLAPQVRAGRVLITRALDDQGRALPPQGPVEFRTTGTGKVSGRQSGPVSGPHLIGMIFGISRDAKKISLVEAVVEFVVPELDRNATFVIPQMRTGLGKVFASGALADAGVKVTLIGPDSVDPLLDQFKPKTPLPGVPNFLSLELEKEDIAVRLHDPENKIAGVEFQTAAGDPIAYDHNGYAHMSGSIGVHTSIYRIPGLPADARFVGWLATPRSVVRVPLILRDVYFN